MDRYNILMVDDDPEATKMLALGISVKAPNLHIETTTNPEECIECVSSKDVDCVLSDYQMPGMNGLDLLKEIRGRGNDVPFIFVTGQGSEAVAREAFREGANDYFTKDICFAHFPRLINSIQQAIEKRAANEARERAEKEWEETFNAIDDLISLHSTDFTIIRANQAMLDLFGGREEDVVGHKCYQLFHHRDMPIDKCPGDELVRGAASIIQHNVDVHGLMFRVKVCPVMEGAALKSFVHIAKPL